MAGAARRPDPRPATPARRLRRLHRLRVPVAGPVPDGEPGATRWACEGPGPPPPDRTRADCFPVLAETTASSQRRSRLRGRHDLCEVSRRRAARRSRRQRGGARGSADTARSTRPVTAGSVGSAPCFTRAPGHTAWTFSRTVPGAATLSPAGRPCGRRRSRSTARAPPQARARASSASSALPARAAGSPAGRRPGLPDGSRRRGSPVQRRAEGDHPAGLGRGVRHGPPTGPRRLRPPSSRRRPPTARPPERRVHRPGQQRDLRRQVPGAVADQGQRLADRPVASIRAASRSRPPRDPP